MHVVTAAVIVRDERVLLARRAVGQSLAGFWEFPGGKVETGESLEECLRRELSEELGISALIGPVYAESVYRYEHGAIRLVALCAAIESGVIVPKVHDAVDWFSPSDILSLRLAPADIPIAEKLAEEKKDV